MGKRMQRAGDPQQQASVQARIAGMEAFNAVERMARLRRTLTVRAQQNGLCASSYPGSSRTAGRHWRPEDDCLRLVHGAWSRAMSSL